MRARRQWVVWRYVEKPNGKLDKTPFKPNHTGRMARTNDPSGWSTFDKALRIYEANPLFDGIGYVFGDGDPYVGLDFDSCLDPETGMLHEAVSQQIAEFDSYTEISPSGTGLKSVVRARKPGTRCSTRETPWGDEFAMFDRTRFFTLTGRVFGEHKEIREAQEAIDQAYRAAFGEEEKPTTTATTPHDVSEGGGIPLADEELINRACKSKNGERFRRHHHAGDASGYPSRSEADFAHLADLCFWTGGDEEQMVRLFTRSALYVTSKGQGYVRRSARKARAMHRGGFYKKKRSIDERPAEVLELVEALERRWWDEPFPGVGGKTLAGMLRALLRIGKRSGTVQPGEGLKVSASVRQLAEIVECHPNTIVNATKRAMAAGMLRKDHERREEESGAFVLFDPRQGCDTPENTCGERVVGGVTTSSHPSLLRPPLADLTTGHYRSRGPAGKGRERALCALEALGPQSAEELAERLGWSRPRDLRARYLDPLVNLGLVERRGDGLYALVGGYSESQDRVRRLPYSTVQLRLSRRYIIDETGKLRRVAEVVETGSIASQEERSIKDRERHAFERKVFRHYLEERRKAGERRPEDDREIVELLNVWDEERGTESVDDIPGERYGSGCEQEPLKRERSRSGSVVIEFDGAEVQDLERIAGDFREGTRRVSVREVFERAREMMPC
ncbi:MAG: hypothetical protein M3R38_05470 [Actinomycetota bacterium]|nr:hypothetical protein [Actinomycetota bacterium]